MYQAGKARRKHSRCGGGPLQPPCIAIQEVWCMARELAGRDIGYYALTLCLLKNLTVEQAFQIIAPDPDITMDDLQREKVRDMYLMWKSGMTLTDIAKLFNTRSWKVGRKIEQYERELKKEKGRQMAGRAIHGSKISSRA